MRKYFIQILFLTSLVFFSAGFFYLWHNHTHTFSYYGEIWADRAGYYVYLPLLFNYGTKTEEFSKNDLSNKTGLGFEIKNNKIYTISIHSIRYANSFLRNC